MAPITTTDRKDFKPLGRRADYTWEILRDRLAQLGPDFALLLAEPITEAGWGRIDWYVEFAGTVRPISDLDAAAADALLERLWDMRQQVHAFADRIESAKGKAGDKGLADALRRACVTPADRQFVWAADSKPVLVAWGFVKIDDTRPETTVIGEGLVRPGYNLRAGLPGATAAVAAPVAPPARAFPWSIPLWLLFVALMGAIYYLLLQACGIVVAPEDSIFRRFVPAACHMSAFANPLVQERAELERKIRNAELEIARQQGDCAPRPQAQLTPAPPQLIQPPGPSIDERLQQQHAQKGALEISLSWNGLEDLDLHVKCPGGEVSHSTRTACNEGHLDVDMNYDKDDVNAVEHSVWADPPAGQYEVSVNFFSLKSQTPRTIPFTVRIVHGTDTQTIEGTVSVVGESKVVKAFTL